MKITVAQLNYHIGNFKGNTAKMLDAVQRAKEDGADIVCFSELATCGYPPRDFLEFDDFICLGEESIAALAEAAQGIAIVVGSVSHNPVPEGKDLYNSVYFLEDGKIKFIQHKSLLPTYDIFDEYRYFEPAHEWGIVEYKGKKIALTVCEDIWNIGNENPLYKICPLDNMMKYEPDFILNVSASPFDTDHAESRINIVKANCDRYKIPMIYVNHVGAQTEVLFDGGSLIASGDGTIHDELPYFEECIKTYELADIESATTENFQKKDKIALIHDGIIMGIKDYFGKLGFTKAILGLSGGIDSAVTIALAARALGAENVHALLMPSQYSSDHSIDDAVALAENLGCPYDIIPIKGIYDAFMDQLAPKFGDLPFNVTEENIQARARGVLNMAMSNKFGNILLNTSNKSEMAVGYGTLYGDMCGGLSVIGDVYKSDVFRLAEYINKDGEVIPMNTITKPPSAELRPNQKDSDSLPDYDILDEILYQYIERTQDPQDIIAMGYDAKLVKRILRLVNINEFKRYQTAPVLRVSSKAFGMGRRMPIVGKYLS
ncbi:MAG: NAD+ synthase [Saprospiraceae bacterium]|nr:NAD+ synthase [Saprospiraceae bacterium]